MAAPRPIVLVIDDNPRIAPALRRICRDLPIHLVDAPSAEAARGMLSPLPVLVICDYRLPGMDGLSFLERLRTDHPSVPSVLHTGEAITRTSIGIDFPVLYKPCPPQVLRDLISSVLSSHKTCES